MAELPNGQEHGAQVRPTRASGGPARPATRADLVRTVLDRARSEAVGVTDSHAGLASAEHRAVTEIRVITDDEAILADAAGHALAAFLTAPARGPTDLRAAALLSLAGADLTALVETTDVLRAGFVATLTTLMSLPKPEDRAHKPRDPHGRAHDPGRSSADGGKGTDRARGSEPSDRSCCCPCPDPGCGRP